MDAIKLIMQVLAAVLGSLAALVSLPLFRRFHMPAFVMWGLKVVVSPLAPLLALLGVCTALVGLGTGSAFISVVGIYTALAFSLHTRSITRPPAASTGFKQAFGPAWENNLAPEQQTYFLSRRTTFWLPAVPEPRFEQNILFATVPGTGRRLLCDVWQPPVGVHPSGLAFIYLHGGAWYVLDKDLGTRPFFRHLAAQGHLIMDVAYRLAPETDLMGMVQDVQRAIVWLKEHARAYRIIPTRIVVGGGSAGGHLALLAAYGAHDPAFTPTELREKDTSVCGGGAVCPMRFNNDVLPY